MWLADNRQLVREKARICTRKFCPSLEFLLLFSQLPLFKVNPDGNGIYLGSSLFCFAVGHLERMGRL